MIRIKDGQNLELGFSFTLNGTDIKLTGTEAKKLAAAINRVDAKTNEFVVANMVKNITVKIDGKAIRALVTEENNNV